MNEIVFEFEGTPEDRDQQARHLVAWLNDSRGLRGTARCRGVPPKPGEQGALVDAAITLVCAAPLVARPFFTWLTERAKSRRVVLRITRSGSDGSTLRIDVQTPADVRAFEERIARLLDDGQ